MCMCTTDLWLGLFWNCAAMAKEQKLFDRILIAIKLLSNW